MKSTFGTPVKLLRTLIGVAGAALLSLSFQVTAANAIDSDAAKALSKKNDCTKCHAIEKTKKGPSYQKVAAKYKGESDAAEKILKSITTGPKVKLEDGTEEDHKILESKDPKAIKNLVDWILAQ